MKKNVYQVITNRIIDSLEQGTVPWQKPWGGQEQHPRSLVTGKRYRGINTFLLSHGGYESPYWLTFKQAKARGGHVYSGEKGSPCIYWNWFDKKNTDTGELEQIPFLRYYTVFNTEQCKDIQTPKVESPSNPHAPIKACEQVISQMPNPPTIRHGGNRAFYRSLDDLVQMPPKERFHDPESYYSTLFHEMVHSTGHDKRLARDGIVKPCGFGSDLYSKEELVAEMGSAFLAGHTGIETKTIDNSAAYIDSWLRRLRKDNRLVVTAGARAQKAADYILKHKLEDS